MMKNLILQCCQWLDLLKANLTNAAANPMSSYRIVAVDDSYQDTGSISIKVQVVGKSKTFNRSVKELYHKDWLEQFSREDVAHIAALYTAEHTNNFELIKRFPQQSATMKSSVLMVTVLFTAFLVLSNLTAFKLAAFGSFHFPAGLIFFPITYVFGDILTEVYGFKTSRRIIWMALFANLIIFLGTWITIHLPAAPYWPHQEAYAAVHNASFRIFIASLLSYLAGEFINSIVLAKLKVFTLGRYFWLRIIASTMLGIGIDTLLFIHIAFLFTLPYETLWKIIASMYAAKVLYEICAIPVTYKIANFLKKKDNIDHYDFQTSFNPFSLKI